MNMEESFFQVCLTFSGWSVNMKYFVVLKVSRDGEYAGAERQLHKSINEAESYIAQEVKDLDNEDFDFYIDEVEA